MGHNPPKAPIVSTLLMAMLAWPWGTTINAVEAAAREAQESALSPARTLKPAGTPQLDRLGNCGRKADATIAANADEPGNLDDEGLSFEAAFVSSSFTCLPCQGEAQARLIESRTGCPRVAIQLPYRLRC